jgi:hypothetical protein
MQHTNLSTCEICLKNRQTGNHEKCSREKQRRAEAAKPKRKSPKPRTYENSRLLTGFLKAIGD